MLRGIDVVDYEIKISKRFVDVVYSITELTLSRRRPLIYRNIYQWTGPYHISMDWFLYDRDLPPS